jgi:hypothetical protein
MGTGILEASYIMTHADRERVKRELSISEHQGDNHLNRAWIVKTYIHVNGEKYEAIFSRDMYCTPFPSGPIYGDSLEHLREAVISALAEQKKAAVPNPALCPLYPII